MKKRMIALGIGIILTAATLMGCGGNSSTAASGSNNTQTNSEVAGASENRGIPDNYVLRVGANNVTGAFYQFAVTAIDMCNKNCSGWSATPVTTGGSTDTYQLMLANEVDTCAPSAVSMAIAMEGDGEWNGQKIEDQLMWTATFPEYYYILTTAGSKAETFDDLQGKKVSIGTQGSGYYTCSMRFFKELGIDPDEYFDLVYLGVDDATSALQEGSLDAFMYLVGNSTNVSQLAESSSGVKLISFSDEQIQTLLDKDPYLQKQTIPAGTFKGVDEDYVTVGDSASMVSLESTNVPDEVVYDFVKTINEHHDEIAAVNQNFENITAQATVDAFYGVVKFHPGAEKYYREIGLIQ